MYENNTGSGTSEIKVNKSEDQRRDLPSTGVDNFAFSFSNIKDLENIYIESPKENLDNIRNPVANLRQKENFESACSNSQNSKPVMKDACTQTEIMSQAD